VSRSGPPPEVRRRVAALARRRVPAPPGSPGPSLPWLKGRNSVSSPWSRVVRKTRLGSTAKWTSARRAKFGSEGSRSWRYWCLACSTFWAVSGFFSSAVAVGMPFTSSTKSSVLSGSLSEYRRRPPDHFACRDRAQLVRIGERSGASPSRVSRSAPGLSPPEVRGMRLYGAALPGCRRALAIALRRKE